MKSMNFVLIWLIIGLIPVISLAQGVNEDGDNIPDKLEQELATKFAPEWRFTKKTKNSPTSIIDGSNQNDTEDNYPSSVKYLEGKNLNVQFFYNSPLKYNIQPVTDINNLDKVRDEGFGIATSDDFFGVGCPPLNSWSKQLLLDWEPDNLPGEPYSFPTYYHCGKISNDRVVITYFLFSAFNKTRESHLWIDFGNHRGDWEWYSVVLKNLDITNGRIDNSAVDYFLFEQHGKNSTKTYLEGSSNRWRKVFETHPKMYVALGSHAIYPEPGILENIDQAIDIYDDNFLGNGLVVRSWQLPHTLVNMGENPDFPPGKAMKNTEWIRYKGLWGGQDNGSGSDGPPGPVCRWSDGTRVSTRWEDWVSSIASGNLDLWEGIYLDCLSYYSKNQSPNQRNDCDVIVDCHQTCGGWATTIDSDLPVYNNIGHILPFIQYKPSPLKIGILPCNYPKMKIDKPMILKAIEGTVIIGR
jgi:hypothetical protein